MRYTKGGRLKRRKITLTPRELGGVWKRKSSEACPNTTNSLGVLPTEEGQLHFSTNLRENANARGIWQQWPWSVPPILRVGFLVEAREREDGRGVGEEGERESAKAIRKDRSGKETQGAAVRVGGWWLRHQGWVEQGALPAMQSREKQRSDGSSNPRRPTSAAIYWLSQPPDKGGQPRSIRGHPPTYPSILCPTPEPRCILSTQLTLPHEAFSTNLVSCPYSDSANDPPSLKIYTPERVTLNPSNFRDYSPLVYFSNRRLCTLSLFLRRTPSCNALMKIYERNLPSWKFVYPGGSRADEGEGVEFGFPDIRRIFENIRCIWRG